MRSDHLDPDLLEPSLDEHDGRAREPGERPWRLDSQLWVAFFGGVLATTFISCRNAERLGLDRLVRTLLVLGAITLALSVTLGALAVAHGTVHRNVRLITRGCALLYYVVSRRLQRQADGVYVATGGTYDSLWKPGLLAVFGLGIGEGILMALTIDWAAP